MPLLTIMSHDMGYATWVGMPQRVGKYQGISQCLESGHPKWRLFSDSYAWCRQYCLMLLLIFLSDVFWCCDLNLYKSLDMLIVNICKWHDMTGFILLNLWLFSLRCSIIFKNITPISFILQLHQLWQMRVLSPIFCPLSNYYYYYYYYNYYYYYYYYNHCVAL